MNYLSREREFTYKTKLNLPQFQSFTATTVTIWRETTIWTELPTEASSLDMATDPELEAWGRADRARGIMEKVVRESQGTMVEEATIRTVAATTSTTVMMANKDQDLEKDTKVEATIEIDRKVATQSHLTVEAIKIEAIDMAATTKEATEEVVDSQRSQTHLL